MVLKILKIVGIVLGALFVLLFGIAFSKVDKNSTSKLKDAFAGLFGNKSGTNSLLLGNKSTGSTKKPSTLVGKVPVIIPDAPISAEEQNFIDLNGFELPSIITLSVIDPIRISGAAPTEVYTRKLNTILKTNQVGWTRNGEEVFKMYNTNGSFYYTIVPYVPIDPPQPLD